MRRFCRFSSTLRCHSCQRVCSVREHARVVDRIINLSAFARACVCVCVLTPILVWHLYFYGGQQPLSMLPVPAAYDCGPYRAGPGSYHYRRLIQAAYCWRADALRVVVCWDCAFWRDMFIVCVCFLYIYIYIGVRGSHTQGISSLGAIGTEAWQNSGL